MRFVTGCIIVALLLAAAGGVSWTFGKNERALADVDAQVLTMQFAEAADNAAALDQRNWYARLSDIGSNSAADARRDQATANYWVGRYDRLSSDRGQSGAGAQDTLMASNAAYRATQAESVDRATALQHLESVVKSYAEVLKANPDDVDAAYNYEFVVRTRNALAKPAVANAKPGTDTKPNPANRVTTIHGRPGAPPADVNMAAFKVIIPKRSEERQENPEASKGGVKTRKG